ncbi:MAG: hypothetical protein P8M78_07825 [Myxococcota bacterium]|nr:hypothetical protein [Myxococcota bacterium]
MNITDQRTPKNRRLFASAIAVCTHCITIQTAILAAALYDLAKLAGDTALAQILSEF